jgi:hypothetical protein
MASVERKLEAEVRMRDLIEREGLPPPDHIEYGYTCIRLIWWERKLAVIVDLDD